MQRYRVQASQPYFLIPAWLTLLVATALLALYGAMVADASWEVEVTRWIQAASPDALQAVAEFMTLIGRSPISFVVPAIAVLALWLFGQGRLSAFLILAAFARMLSPVVKSLVDRPRPSASLVDVAHQLGDPSFPSGHVLGATLFYGFLIYCAEYVFPERRIVLRVVQGAFASIIGLMAYARVQLGEHWPTDALGGFALGLLILTAIIWLHRRMGQPGHEERFAPAPRET